MKKLLIILITILFIPMCVNAETHYLYNVLKNEAESNGLAKEYTGEHHDSFTEEPTKKIYHWYAETDEQGNQVLEKNNVIFGDYCWHMIRTTDTGGVKLIYNGIPNEGKCNNYGDATTIGSSSYSSGRYAVGYVGYMYNPDTALTTRSAEYTPSYGTRFAESFSYSDGMFNLINTSSSLSNTRHYGCLNGENSCSQIAFYFWLTNGYYRYIVYDSNKTADLVLNDMLSSNNVNSTNSNIKEYIDNWYQDNLNSLSDYIEDTIYCNDRSIIDLGGWDPNGGNTNGDRLEFNNYEDNQSLICTNETDKFSLANNLAKLDYPVGLITKPEFVLLNNNSIRKSGITYYLMSPYDAYGGYPTINGVNSSGQFYCISNLNSNNGIRPSISLKSRIKYSVGNGSKDNPYIIDLNNYYGIDVEINNETEDFNIEIDDLSTVPEGETVNFIITPIKGHKVTSIRIIDEDNNEVEYTSTDNKNFTFIMPSSDVTIIPSYERVKNAVIMEDNKNTKEFVIEVNDSQAVVYEDTVRFRVEPEEGYEVESIDITDEEENKISYRKTNTVNEYEFTMPDTDVLIKPKYRLLPVNNTPTNPNTGRQILFLVLAITILIASIIIKKKRLN